jgi:16S rRNA (guanine966-N2)-methyltransferase
MSAQRFADGPPPTQYDIVYIDPPYDFAEADLFKCLVSLRAGGFLKMDAMVAVEKASKSAALKWPDGYESLRERGYGQALIRYATVVELGQIL